MKKNILFMLGMLAIMLAFGAVLVGCKKDPDKLRDQIQVLKMDASLITGNPALEAKIAKLEEELYSQELEEIVNSREYSAADVEAGKRAYRHGESPLEAAKASKAARGDGKQAAPPATASEAANSEEFTPTHKVSTNDKSNLRLREGQSTNAKVVTSLENGSLVQVLETGSPFKDSDGNAGNWLRVTTANGTQGWCFGAYLLPVQN